MAGPAISGRQLRDRRLGCERPYQISAWCHPRSLNFTPIADSATMSARTDEEATNVQNATGVTPDSLKEKLEKELEATHVEIQDMSGNTHAAPSSEVLQG